MSNIGQWDRLVLQELFEHGAMTVSELMRSVPIEQFELGQANAWVTDALGREIIEETRTVGGPARYSITDRGRAVIDVPPGR